MKDINSGIDNSKLKEIEDILFRQHNNEAKERQRIETCLEKIVSKIDKIKFLRIEKKKYLLNLSIPTFAASGYVSYSMPPGTELFLDKWISDKIGMIELEMTDIQSDGMDFIKDELHERFLRVEGMFKKEKEFWINRAPKHKTECAAFCEVLFNHSYFIKEKIVDLMKTNEFANARYGYNVYNMLKAGKAEERKHYFSKFNKAFL